MSNTNLTALANALRSAQARSYSGQGSNKDNDAAVKRAQDDYDRALAAARQDSSRW